MLAWTWSHNPSGFCLFLIKQEMITIYNLTQDVNGGFYLIDDGHSMYSWKYTWILCLSAS